MITGVLIRIKCNTLLMSWGSFYKTHWFVNSLERSEVLMLLRDISLRDSFPLA